MATGGESFHFLLQRIEPHAVALLTGAPAEAQAARTHLESVLRDLRAGAYILSQSGELVLLNDYAMQIWDAPMPPNLASFTWEIYHPDGRLFRQDEYQSVRALSRGETSVDREFAFRRSNGSLGQALSSCGPLRDGRGSIVGVFCTFWSDVRDRG